MTATLTRSPMGALTEGMSERTAELVRIAIRRAIRNGQERDRLLYEEYPPIAKRVDRLEHSHGPGVIRDSACARCDAENEEAIVLARVDGCTERLNGSDR